MAAFGMDTVVIEVKYLPRTPSFGELKFKVTLRGTGKLSGN